MRAALSIVATTAAVLLGAAPALAASYVPHSAPNHKLSFSTSSNWSGYAVSGSGPYTSVSSSWVEPAVTCPAKATTYSSFWVGLDGDTTSTVEQTGSEADCSRGTPLYYSWYEMYPAAPVNFTNTVRVGDTFTGTVSSNGSGQFTLTLTDNTQGWTQTEHKTLAGATLGSAEVIAEAPSSGSRVLPLSNFNDVFFGAAQPATVNGAVLTSATPGLDPITMSGGGVTATPSPISNGVFNVQYAGGSGSGGGGHGHGPNG